MNDDDGDDDDDDVWRLWRHQSTKQVVGAPLEFSHIADKVLGTRMPGDQPGRDSS